MAEGTKEIKSTGSKNSIVRYFKDTKSELKKVVWPTRAQVINNTLTVLLCCLVVGIIIWLADGGLSIIREKIFKF